MNKMQGYEDREHSFIKHELLKTYSEKLFMIIGQHEPRICYVDCFAGPWQEEDDNLSGTSIARSFLVMSKCRNSLRNLNRHIEFRALFVEKNNEAYEKLQSFLKSKDRDGISAEAKHGSFHELRDEILEWCGQNDFVFFFIDPTGWKHAIEIPT
ncbi:MAG: three-Cys-motif partner protein TcmP, partial [Gammaproteobacteria bacterium]|nr:three-Cys-motif partner protein TcmP [Gammaproteobacteria bacterium]